ncbi:MAG TPA: DUF58 domain-containing protein [Acidothermaceae bacterium]
MAESVFPTARVQRLRITSNGWAAVAGAGLMFALAVQTQSVWMQVVGSALVGLLGISAISVMRRRDGLTVSMQVPTEVSVGVPFDFEVEVSNGGRRRTAPLRITCYFPASIPVIVPPPVVYVDPVLAGEKTTVSITRVAVRRGFVNQTVLMVDAIGSFGFFRSARPFDGVGGMSAAPLAGPPLDLPRVLGVQAEGFGPLGPGLDVRGVREWRPGDAVRHVHWRSTARTGRIAVLDYAEPTVGTIGVLVAGTAPDARFEAALAVALSTAWRALGDDLHLIVPFWIKGEISLMSSTTSSLSPSSWHRIFSVIRAEVPDPATVDALFAGVGTGGIVLMAIGDGVSSSFLSYVESTALLTGVRVIDCAEYTDGQL